MKKSQSSFLYQGEGKAKQYFEGWYYKIVDKTEKNIFAVIPGVSRGESLEDSHCFLQFFDGINCTSHYIKYPIHDFSVSKDRAVIRIGDNYFTPKGMILNAEGDGVKIEGKLDLKEMYLWPSSLKEPNSMGWYAHIPFMECYHGIISLNHSIKGKLMLNDNSIDFEGGRGYLEKDWGKSFPSSWIWFQSNHFDKAPVSLSLSIARIPFLGIRFTGFIGGLLIGKKLYRFTTYSGARLRELSQSDNKLYVLLEGKRYNLEVLIDRDKCGGLISPRLGVMEGKVQESMTTEARVRLFELNSRGKKLIFEAAGRNGGLEIMGDMRELSPT